MSYWGGVLLGREDLNCHVPAYYYNLVSQPASSVVSMSHDHILWIKFVFLFADLGSQDIGMSTNTARSHWLCPVLTV